MSKRELASLTGATDVEASRPKRRREAVETVVGSSSDVDVTVHEAKDTISGGNGEGNSANPEEVKEQGMKLWQAVKDAVNKEGRSLSLDFLRKPSKRQYPDYYQLIKKPIALDDIKSQIENGGYSSLEAIRQAFELCFTNAKQYNMRDSDIWKDAKELLKVVNKAYHKLAPPDEDGENGAKSKLPSLNRLMKSRLQKVVDKTDNTGRTMSTEFMELPSKKDWPMYYKEIKRPQCLENIFKRIKRKEYFSAAEFAADVELVFSNAMTFNQDHTPIWEDARSLRDYFRTLMADLPPPFALPQYAKPNVNAIHTKIKIKPQGTAAVIQAAAAATGPPAKLEASTPSSLFLRVPATGASSNVQKTPSQPAAISVATTPAPPAPVPSAAVSSQQHASGTTPAQVKSATPQPAPQVPAYNNSTFPHYPNASYPPPLNSTSSFPATSSSSTPPPPLASVINSHSTSRSPAPTLMHPIHQLKSVTFRIQPRGRLVCLHCGDGVKTWAMRLASDETRILIGNVLFQGGDEEEESSGDEEADHEPKKEEEEMDVDVEAEHEAPVKNGRRKKGKGRGRPGKTTRSVAQKALKAQETKKKSQKVGEVQLKVNGVVLKEQGEQPGEWDVQLRIGSNIVEVGEVGGMVWKAYVERPEA